MKLRNPLTAIGGFIKLLRSNLSPEALQQVGKYIDVNQSEFENFQSLLLQKLKRHSIYPLKNAAIYQMLLMNYNKYI